MDQKTELHAKIIEAITEKKIATSGEIAVELSMPRNIISRILVSMGKRGEINHKTSDRYNREGCKVTVYYMDGTPDHEVYLAIDEKMDRRGGPGRKKTEAESVGLPLDSVWMIRGIHEMVSACRMKPRRVTFA